MLKWALFALVIAFVGRKAWQLWSEGDIGSVTIHWSWLIASGALYLLGWLPSAFFWHRLIHQLGGTSNRGDVTRAFFAGHLGKYIPGKASVLLIRAGLLADKGCRPGVAALTSTYETLVCMGVGAAVGLTLAPVVWPRRVIEGFPTLLRTVFSHPLMFGISVVVVCVVLVPVIAKLLGLIASKFTKPVPSEADLTPLNASIEIRSSFLLLWCFIFVTTWLLHGLSLGCALRSVGVVAPWSEWLTWTGDVSSASFLGFLAIFAPGGLGVREGILIELLKVQPGISQSQAVAATVLLRGVWLVAEIIAAAGLGAMARYRDRP
ncbi:MAG: lysylphosphatidylglycerol synthase transmembrane domain-containing protein [Planctomycetia bacterium]|nr:lysylphosphatidylglycerol synthase transmembrane domain-containing protein [Planctomycetia bacterium]